MSSLTILLPIAVGLILWDKLPEELPSHWGTDGQVNGWTEKGLAVFALPGFLLLMHLWCVFMMAWDPKGDGHPEKVINIVLCICPAVSCLTGSVVYATAMGSSFQVGSWITAVAAVLFILFGNYMPKCKRNYTLGIKLPWTLNSDANWNATHRLAGRVWVVGGFVMLLGCFLPNPAAAWVTVSVALLVPAIPTVYSYWFYKKHGL